jgi:hypothetical protein
MFRLVVAMTFASSLFVAISGTAQAAPIAPVFPGYIADFGILSDVSWRRCWRDRWGRMHCRRCWRDRWGHVRCR